MLEWFRRFFEPEGYVLYRFDGTRHNVIRGDLIPADTIIIVQNDRHFVDTGTDDDSFGKGWRVYREFHKSYEYEPWA